MTYIIDADLITRKNHRFPNLACMKIAGYLKDSGEDIMLKMDYDGLQNADKVYISKVFTDTYVPESVLRLDNVEYGGTGFYYDSAPPLAPEVEHHMPYYHLYDDFVTDQLNNGSSKQSLKFYTDYSVGFLTRGCFRHCEFCVNKHYDKVRVHSPLAEFVDYDRKKICLLDDNILGSAKWKELLNELRSTGKPFRFQQGMDERLLNDEKCQVLMGSRYDGDMTFAFDNIADREVITKKLQLLRSHTDKQVRFYCFTGFDRNDRWDADFWEQDIFDLAERIKILMAYNCLPYVMRFARYTESPYKSLYVTIARWANQPAFFKKKSLREFCEIPGNNVGAGRSLDEFLAKRPDFLPYSVMKYIDVTPETIK